MKRFRKDLRDHATRIIDFKKKFIIPLIKDEEDKLVDNLTEGVHNDKCVKCKSNLCFMRAIDETLIFECIDCKKKYKKDFYKKLINGFSNFYEC